ncbi:hypothetical protein D915_006812 [Fasciola hepatica]|uniref:Uncharacterized protein n=1 Tax=Fasciola hepatica TaxID=6192 RepID=A0A4E0R8R0_FASHE|nr:hypothetical protein D915_006812 [Fasciola hepatica]
MGLGGKLLCLIACAIGVVCTLAPILVDRDKIKEANNYGNHYKGAVASAFIAMLIFAAGLIFLFITLCCSCSDICMGIVISVIGGASLFFTICAYALSKNAQPVPSSDIPNTPEWFFGSIVASTEVILCSLALAVS